MNERQPFTVGVIGGMGSYATVHFFRALLDAFPADKEWERPRIIIDNRCDLPSRVRAILYEERVPEVLDGLAASMSLLLDAGASVLAFPCNTVHHFIPRVVARLDRDVPWLDMLDLAADACSACGLREVLVLASEGTVKSAGYDERLAARGIVAHYPGEADQARVRAIIEHVKHGGGAQHPDFDQLLREAGGPVLLGCTELSALARTSTRSPLVVDPVAALIAAIRARRTAS